ncbi:glutamate racemase [Patiriisocius hiemis]|uniref:Glutamate racemase n=1 Tax=Patiriisocius hiemis TaxID=3075604 RepID=A0ABU2YFL2_9FLAO|nr:glutamate racemase [Constantimarinum sp. W242]MDT0556974.1 glutamate racemase [Constantimarinum sp. W242]
MNTSSPIGIFDSGVGGSSIWKAIHQLLPNENTIYLADSKNAPYGNKTQDEIIALSIKNTELLLRMKCKVIVVACNTATTNAIHILRNNYDIPIIGIEPAIKPAALNTKTKSVGILATKGTLSSTLFHATTKQFAKDITITEVIGEGLVPLIEAGKLDSPEMIKLLQMYLAPMLSKNIDHLVLGCSHYPYLISQLKELLPSEVMIIDSGAAVAKQTKAILAKNKLLNNTSNKVNLDFYINNSKSTLELLLKDYISKIKVSEKDF